MATIAQLQHILQGQQQGQQQTPAQTLQSILGPLLGQVDAGNNAVAEIEAQRRASAPQGPRRCLESRGMQLPKLGAKVPFEDCAFSFKLYIRTVDRDAAGALKVVEEDSAWHSVVAEATQAKFSDMRDVPADLFGLPVNATEGDDLQAVESGEGGVGFEAWWKVTCRRVPRRIALAVRLVGFVAPPPKHPGFGHARNRVRKWDDHQRTLAT